MSMHVAPSCMHLCTGVCIYVLEMIDLLKTQTHSFSQGSPGERSCVREHACPQLSLSTSICMLQLTVGSKTRACSYIAHARFCINQSRTACVDTVHPCDSFVLKLVSLLLQHIHLMLMQGLPSVSGAAAQPVLIHCTYTIRLC